MMDDETNVWGRELTDEEIEMAAGGLGSFATTPVCGEFVHAVRGLADIIAGNATHNQELVNEGLSLLGFGMHDH